MRRRRSCTTSPGSPAPKRPSSSRPVRQRLAAELGLILVTPDTSPRAHRHRGSDGRLEPGEAAGFYLDATTTPARAALPHVQLRDEGTAGRDRRELRRGRSRARRRFGHSMAATARVDHRTQESGSLLPVSAFGADRRAEPGAGARRRCHGIPATTRRGACTTRSPWIEDGHRFPARSSSTRATADKFLEPQLAALASRRRSARSRTGADAAMRTRATTTATTSRPSWKTTCCTMRRR